MQVLRDRWRGGCLWGGWPVELRLHPLPAPRPGVFLYAFDLLQLGVDDLRRDPLEVRKATLQSVLSNAGPGIRYNEHIEGDAEDIFRHACKLSWKGLSASCADRPTAPAGRRIGSR